MPKTIKSQLRKVIYNINNYLSERRSEGIDSIPLNNITDLVVNMTGISRSSVMKIRREGQTSVVFSTPKKNKPKTKKKINLDDFDLCAIRHKLQEFYAVRKEVPSLKRLLAALKESINFVGGRESLRLLLHTLGYKFKKCRNQRTILMERYDIVAWRDRYLQEIKDVRKSGMPVVYLDESYIHTSLNQAKCWQSENEPGGSKSVAKGKRYVIVHCGGKTGFVPNALLIYNDKEKKDFHDAMNTVNFKKWVLDKLIPNLHEPTCIVMDNARYHSSQINKPPSMINRKKEITDWLSSNNIAYPTNATKSMLMVIVKQNKPDPIYEIDHLVQDYGHKIVRLPPYHCDLNPIEMIWGIVKGKVATKNVGLDNITFMQLVKNCFEDTWNNCCEHTKKIE
ncbi:uncharacterized protein LOC113512254 [Galleria mellonella]|uniref:Uncharacterized protein LOC113512254 n=1 Tax=Galleria mellonella TaxID=7137 RepID=A0ABM3MZK9_GALME|nr:uncharacterized protein LOC113512254 [Galleria mellonella]